MENIEKLSEKELTKKINELAKKAKETNLTKDEIDLRDILRKEYIRRIKNGLKGHLDNIKPKD